MPYLCHHLVRPLLTMLVLVFMATLPVHARAGISGQMAPAWQGLEWLNLPEDVADLDVGDFRGKVLYVFCFQSWCPGCHRHGFPALQEVSRHFEGNDDVHFVAIQTVFEGHGTNTSLRGLDEVKGYGLEIPVAQSENAEGHGTPLFMRAYRTGGTPWTIVIDPEGRVRFDGFHVEPEKAVALIESLMPSPKETSPQTPSNE